MLQWKPPYVHQGLDETFCRILKFAIVTAYARAPHMLHQLIMFAAMREVICMHCGWRAPMQVAIDRVRDGEADPACGECGGILKSATISFGQSLDPRVIDRAMRAAERADLLLAIGSSLQVYPVAGAVPLAKAAGARIVIVNAEPTPFDDIADVVFRQPIGEILPALCARE